MKINLVGMYVDIYKGSVIIISPIVVIFRAFAPGRDFGKHPMLFFGVILVCNSWIFSTKRSAYKSYPGPRLYYFKVFTMENPRNSIVVSK